MGNGYTVAISNGRTLDTHSSSWIFYLAFWILLHAFVSALFFHWGIRLLFVLAYD